MRIFIITSHLPDVHKIDKTLGIQPQRLLGPLKNIFWTACPFKSANRPYGSSKKLIDVSLTCQDASRPILVDILTEEVSFTSFE